jgi:hypothetical protein
MVTNAQCGQSKKKKKKKKKREKSKAIPVTGREMSRIPHCLDSRLSDGGKVVNPTHQPRSTTQKHYFSAYRTHFC